MDYAASSLRLHQKYRGKISLKLKVPLKNKKDLAIAYTPGVGAVATAIYKDKKKSWQLTNRANQVAIVSDGSAVLGLGNLGPEAAMPVMEGKAAIFKAFADIDAIPLCIDTQEPEEIINFCKRLEPSFAGINLEDIAAPRCFEVLGRLEEELTIPVFHDDQDGTAIVVLAALINACRLTKKNFKKLQVVISGAGAAGLAIARLLIRQGVKELLLVDSCGLIYEGRLKLNQIKAEISCQTNSKKIKGDLGEALKGADVFIGVSKANLLTKEMIKKMARQPIIFAMANPVPEIMPALALEAGAAIVGTGRSDFPNQINNALVFPGIFRGLLDGKIRKVTVEMKIAVAKALANSLQPQKNKILPLVTDRRTVAVIARSIKKFNK
ncbi:MAG: NADP-dependent malic enzyme [Patescibacteria group bacterium]